MFQTLMNLHQGSVAKVVAREEGEAKADPADAVVEEVALPYFINTRRLEAGEELRFYKEDIAKEKKMPRRSPSQRQFSGKRPGSFEPSRQAKLS